MELENISTQKEVEEIVSEDENPVWNVTWQNFFNPNIKKILFEEKPYDDETDKEVRKCFKNIEDIYSNIRVDNSYETAFLRLISEIDGLLREPKANQDLYSTYKNKKYYFAAIRLIQNWMQIRKEYIFYLMDNYVEESRGNGKWRQIINKYRQIYNQNTSPLEIERIELEIHYLRRYLPKVDISLDAYNRMINNYKSMFHFNDLLAKKREQILARKNLYFKKNLVETEQNDMDYTPSTSIFEYLEQEQKEEVIYLNILTSIFKPSYKASYQSTIQSAKQFLERVKNTLKTQQTLLGFPKLGISKKQH